MRKIILLFFAVSLLFLFTGCQEMENLNAQLDQTFVDGVMTNLQIKKNIENVIPSGSSIYLYNMDEPKDDDWATFLDSKLSDQLASSNFMLLERNPKYVDKMLQERTNKSFSVYYEETKLSQLINKISVKDISVNDLLNEEIMKFFEKDRNNIYLIPTHLKPADYMISYRILEAQLNYSYHESPWLVSFYNSTLGAFGNFVNSAVRETDHTINVNRKGNIKLQLNVTNTKTGEIIYAKNLESLYSDTFKGDDRLSYQDFTYYFISPLKKKSIVDKGQNILSVGYKFQGMTSHLVHINYDMISNTWVSIYYDQDFLANASYFGFKYGIPLQAGTTSAFIPFIGFSYGDTTALKYGFDVYYRLFNLIQLGYTVENNKSGDILTNGDKSITIKWLLD
jgi:hypothetical protein